MTGLETDSGGSERYEVGVAIIQMDHTDVTRPPPDDEAGDGAVPGYDETWERTKPHGADHAPLVERGQDAVRLATEALATQVGLAAKRIAAAIGEEGLPPPADAGLGLESVQVSFGVTFTAGLQALFTAEAASSAQVTITLSRPSAGRES